MNGSGTFCPKCSPRKDAVSFEGAVQKEVPPSDIAHDADGDVWTTRTAARGVECRCWAEKSAFRSSWFHLWGRQEQKSVRRPRVGSVLAGAFLYRQQLRKNGNKGTNDALANGLIPLYTYSSEQKKRTEIQ